MQNYFKQPITDYDQAAKFLLQLNADNLIFHPEDDPATIIDLQGNYIFTSIEAEAINDRMEEVWLYMEDPCEFILNEIYHNNIN